MAKLGARMSFPNLSFLLGKYEMIDRLTTVEKGPISLGMDSLSSENAGFTLLRRIKNDQPGQRLRLRVNANRDKHQSYLPHAALIHFLTLLPLSTYDNDKHASVDFPLYAVSGA